MLGTVWATQWSSGSLKRVRGSLLFYWHPPFLFLCKRSLMEVSLVQQREHWWFCTTWCNCSVSSLQTTSHQWPSHSPRGQGYWVAFRKKSYCSLTSPAIAVKSSVHWTLFAPLSSKAPHTFTNVSSAPKQIELSLWALLPVGFVFSLFLYDSVEHVFLSLLFVCGKQSGWRCCLNL